MANVGRELTACTAAIIISTSRRSRAPGWRAAVSATASRGGSARVGPVARAPCLWTVRGPGSAGRQFALLRPGLSRLRAQPSS
eukprot:scaffold641_cov237-Pinguiococcus_pyrenoidosus.AAC.12